MKNVLQFVNFKTVVGGIRFPIRDGSGGRAWTVGSDGIQPVAGGAAGDVLLVPAEDVLTLGVALPLPSHGRRLAALPFAIEDRIADRLDAVHLALATWRTGANWLAAVVDRDRMQAWLTAAEEAGLGDASLMPDALALPLPAEGRWNVLRGGDGRILVRRPDGTGFAARQPLFLVLWQSAGKPPCDELAGFDALVPIELDLRQGPFARPRQGLSATARRVAMVAAMGLLAHGAIAAADTVTLRSIAARRGAELIAALDTAAPGRFTASDPHEAAAIAADLLPAASRPPGTLIPLLGRTSSALAPFGNLLTVRGLDFDEGGRRLLIDAELADPTAAPNVVEALRRAGLSARFAGGRLIVGAGAAP